MGRPVHVGKKIRICTRLSNAHEFKHTALITYRDSQGWQFDLLARFEGGVREVFADVVFNVQHRVAVVFGGASFNFSLV